jgi:DAK2 domain fusion protein YloV
LKGREKEVSITKITSCQLQEMLQAGSEYLANNDEYVNSLNVFPVPDGDTGTNMNMSMTTGAKAVADTAKEKVSEVASIFAKGLLMGARGNSGVILSQLFRGFAKSTEGKDFLDANDLADAFRFGVETAYNAVMKPVEGTILTVARGAAKYAIKSAKQNIDVAIVMRAAVMGAKKYLAKTPELLPVLKEVGVVDSGGQGLVYIYEGFLASLTGAFETAADFIPTPAAMDQLVDVEHHKAVASHVASEDIKLGFCTEIMVQLSKGQTATEKFDYDAFRNYLARLGDSLLVVNDDKILKVHIHTEVPGEIISYGQKFGALVKVKVDNMRLQHDTIIEKTTKENASKKKVPYAVIAIAVGDGLKKLFLSLGVDHVIAGGQTMNPSTEDILTAIKEANAKNIIILPNNKNIFMAAESAAEVAEIPVAIIYSRTIPQGIATMLAFNPDLKLEENKKNMTEMLTNVTSAQVTTAVRDTTIDGIDVHKNDYIGIIEGKIVISKPTIIETSIAILEQMINDETEIITILIGKEGTQDDADIVASTIEKNYSDIQVEIYPGDQPVYPYIFSVE